jgi:hypothetical protein
MTMDKIGLRTLGIGCSLAIAWAVGACSDSGGDTTATGGSTAAGGQTGMGGAGAGMGGSTFPGTGGTTYVTGGTTYVTGGTTGMTGGTTGMTGGTTGMTGGTTGMTGGTTGSGTGGTAGSTGGSAGAPAVPIEGFNVDEGGYINFCGLHGYSWTAAGPPTPINTTGSVSSILPEEFSDLPAGTSLCASGVVAADDEYGGYAIVGINIGQEPGEDTPNPAVNPSGTGVVVNVTNTAKSGLRVQIQDELGSDDAEHRWCADVPSSGSGTIPWEKFNTTCWKPTDGTDYAMEPINAIMIIVPGSNSKDTSFDFCLNGFTVEGVDCPAGGTGGAPGTGGSGGDTGGTTGETGGTAGGGTGGGTAGGDTGGTTGETGGTTGETGGTTGETGGTTGETGGTTGETGGTTGETGGTTGETGGTAGTGGGAAAGTGGA